MQQAALSFANTDFRTDVKNIQLPTLIIHGDSDDIVPIEASSARTVKLIPKAQYKVYEGAPHGLFYPFRKQLNQDLIEFCLDGATITTGVSTQRQVNV